MKISMALLGIIFVAFILQIAIPSFTETFYLNPQNLQIWQFVTSIFLHGGLMHILFNSYALFAFGPILEQKIGQKYFLALFLICGISGNLLYYLTTVIGIIPPIPSLGASGSIYGILGALAVLEPGIVLLLFGIIPLKIRDAAVLWIVMEFLGAFSTSSGIASAAHLGGLVVGILIAMHLKKKITPSYWVKLRGH